MSHHLKQAKHTKELTVQLFNEGIKCIYGDWVITTAYYACNHFVKHHLFPLSDHGIEHKSEPIETYDIYYELRNENSDKHSVLCLLFQEKVNQKHGVSLIKLMRLCHDARYINYEFDLDLVKFAVSTLTSIERICSTRRELPIVKRPTGPDGVTAKRPRKKRYKDS